MSSGPIPFSAIDRYASRYEIVGEDFAYFLRMIRALDKVSREQGEGASGPPLSPEMFDSLF